MYNYTQSHYIIAASCTGAQSAGQSEFCKMRSDARLSANSPQGFSMDPYMVFAVIGVCALLVLFGASIYKKKK